VAVRREPAKSQRERVIEATRVLECDDDKERFEKRLKKIAKAKSTSGPSADRLSVVPVLRAKYLDKLAFIDAAPSALHPICGLKQYDTSLDRIAELI
jgi:hypothetical protein